MPEKKAKRTGNYKSPNDEARKASRWIIDQCQKHYNYETKTPKWTELMSKYGIQWNETESKRQK